MCPASLPHLPLPPPTPHCHLKKKSGKSQLIILELRVASGNNLTHQWGGGMNVEHLLNYRLVFLINDGGLVFSFCCIVAIVAVVVVGPLGRRVAGREGGKEGGYFLSLFIWATNKFVYIKNILMDKERERGGKRMSVSSFLWRKVNTVNK